MGIINLTPDSFYAASRHPNPAEAARTARDMVDAGATMLDLGAYSSRPGAADVSVEEEMERLCAGVEAVRAEVGADVLISVDTFRADVAKEAVSVCGADIVNDISGGEIDPGMFATVAELGCPYVLMHMRGTPATMQSMTDYDDVAAEVATYLSKRAAELHALGVSDVILDPGFGFAKTLEQNYRLLGSLGSIAALGMPVLAGMSRKSMLSKLPGVAAEAMAAATTAVNVLALERGAAILRVHDVAEAVAAVSVTEALNSSL
ncbi:MAG: dihydropteroate synthase [Muribaculaceae bacterium]|nr:dihydropteroate synthase [Muribaculaceae bacterium]